MKVVRAPLSILGLVLAIALVSWLFSLHGTKGLIHVEFVFGIALLIFSAIGVLPLVLHLVSRRRGGKTFNLWTTSLASLSVALSVSGFAYLTGFPQPSVEATEPRLLVVSGTGANGIPDLAVVVESAATARSILSWGRSGSETIVREATATKRHVFLLEDLERGTEYTYSIDGGPEYKFSTPAIASAGLRFAVVSDAHYGASDARNDYTQMMLAQIADPEGSYDYFFSLGDNVEFGFRPEQWNKARSGFAPVTSAIPSVFAPGNHDTLFTGLDRYLDYALPLADSHDPDQLWSRFDVGNVHFLVLDLEWSAETFTRRQAAWLETELKSIPVEDWTIILNHGFYYGSGSVARGWKWYDNKETIRSVTPLFEQYGVDLVFSGHGHQMESLEKSGVTYIVVGAFGGIPDPERTYTSPQSLWYSAANYGYAEVTVDDSSAKVTFRNAQGGELHSEIVTRK